MDEDSRRKTIARLRRAAGQVEGITRMLEEKRANEDVLMQTPAARPPLGRAAGHVLEAHQREVVADALRAGDAASRDEHVAQLLRTFQRYCAD
jgi:DNA-binding FrmR family transcriptional regulator